MKGKFTVLNVRDLLHSLKVHGPACPCRGHTRTHIHIPKSSSIQQKFVPSSTTNVIKIPSRHKTFSTIPPVNSKSILFNDVGDYAFEMATSSIRFGPGVTREVGFDLKDLGAKNVCVIADPNLAKVKDSPVQVVIESIEKQKLKYSLFTDVKVEPTDSSFKAAINFATGKNFDAFVAVGGGSTMDTAKAANLYSTYPPADFLDYVNPPIGKGLQPPGPVKPLICIPTTAGTGSEATGVAIFDLESIHAKTGIASRRIKPTLGIVDPLNTRYLAPEVAACSGFDVLCHSLESYTAIPFYKRTPRPNSPSERLTYQGSNPIADVWSLRSLEMVSKWLPIAVEDPSNDEARSQVLLAATFAGIGFGNAGVHLCHGMSYPVAGMVKNYVPPGYNSKKPMVPHGMSVVLNAPSVFTFTSPADPKRHLKCAEIMGADISKAKDEDAGMILADQIRKIMKRLKMPNGLKAVGYTKQDIPQLVKGTLPQHRVTKLSPRPVGEIELTHLFENAMEVY